MTKEEIKQVISLSLEYYKSEVFGTKKESEKPSDERVDWIYERMKPDVPEDLEEAANKFAVFYDQGTCDGIAQDCFIAGAKWQKEQFEKNRLANCDTLTKEEYDRETAFATEIIENEHRQPTFTDAINYGMRLQKEQDGYDTIFYKGMMYYRKQMMKEAVEGVITNAGGEFGYDVATFRLDDNHTYSVLLSHEEKRKYGDKVRIIIVKEDEK